MKKEHIEIEAKLVEYDKPNINGHIYSKECVEKMVKDFEENSYYITIDNPMNFKVDLTKVAGQFKEGTAKIEDDRLVAEGIIFDTPNGNVLKELLENDVEVAVTSRIVGELNENNEVKNPKLISFAILPNTDETTNRITLKKSEWEKAIDEGISKHAHEIAETIDKQILEEILNDHHIKLGLNKLHTENSKIKEIDE